MSSAHSTATVCAYPVVLKLLLLLWAGCEDEDFARVELLQWDWPDRVYRFRVSARKWAGSCAAREADVRASAAHFSPFREVHDLWTYFAPFELRFWCALWRGDSRHAFLYGKDKVLQQVEWGKSSLRTAAPKTNVTNDVQMGEMTSCAGCNYIRARVKELEVCNIRVKRTMRSIGAERAQGY